MQQGRILHEPFGAHLAHLLEIKELSQAFLSERSGVDRSLISRIIRGDRKPSGESLRYIAVALEMEVTELVRGTDAENRLDEINHSVREDDYREAVQKLIDYEGQNRELATKLHFLEEQAKREEMRREDAERAACEAHVEKERAQRDLADARQQIQHQEQENRRYREALARAVAHVKAIDEKVRELNDELGSAKKTSRLTAILSGVAALSGVFTLAHLLGDSDSEVKTKSNSSNKSKSSTNKSKGKE